MAHRRPGKKRRDERPRRHPPPRPAARERPLAPVALARAAQLLAGPWLWTTRAGAETDLVAELVQAAPGSDARQVGPALVRSELAPAGEGGALEVTFARYGFRLAAEVRGADLAAAAAERLLAALAGARVWAIETWVPDTPETNSFTAAASALAGRVLGEMAARAPEIVARRIERGPGTPDDALLAQLCVVAADRAFTGTIESRLALSMAPGGRGRMRVPGSRPSRAARKIEEAFAWLGVAPAEGDLCVDLGAAPGGWTWRLLERGARVVAVDPAKLAPELLARRGLTHVQDSAFRYEPDEPVDWLFCDMVWRPTEVAALLAKWGRRGWASLLVCNLKLPMKRKVEMLARLRDILATGGWRAIRTRQLYHDREEITLAAHR